MEVQAHICLEHYLILNNMWVWKFFFLIGVITLEITLIALSFNCNTIFFGVGSEPSWWLTITILLSAAPFTFSYIIKEFILFFADQEKCDDDDEMERLYKSLEQASLSPIGDRRLSTKKELRKSFIKRSKNPSINEKLHKIRMLNSTLKVSLQILPRKTWE